MASPIFLSRPAPGFTPVAVVRGAQLTVVGAARVLRNPQLPKHGYYRRAVRAIAISMLLEGVLWAILAILRGILHVGGASDRYEHSLWALMEVLNIRQFLVLVFKDSSTMDDLFIESLRFVDNTNKVKHPGTHHLYGSLANFKTASLDHENSDARRKRRLKRIGISMAKRSGRLALIWGLSHVPVLGRFVLPVIAFVSFQNVVGTSIALAVFSCGLVVPARWIMVFLSAYWGSRSMMNDLLRPYFRRLPFSKTTRDTWFDNRQGILFGFGVAFYLLIKLPYLGVLVYGIASASTAYLLTKITDPVPAPAELNRWTEEQAIWTNTDVTI